MKKGKQKGQEIKDDKKQDQQSQKYVNLRKWLWRLFYIVIWGLAYKLVLKYNFGTVYFTISLILLIFLNLGEREKGSLSAYSVFNKGGERLLGEFAPENVEGMFGGNANGNNQNNNVQQSQNTQQNQSYDLNQISKFANKLCPCGSDKKFKKCCYNLEVEKREQERQLQKRRAKSLF